MRGVEDRLGRIRPIGDDDADIGVESAANAVCSSSLRSERGRADRDAKAFSGEMTGICARRPRPPASGARIDGDHLMAGRDDFGERSARRNPACP